MTIVPSLEASSSPEGRLAAFQLLLERELDLLLATPDEVGLDARWDRARANVHDYALRPAKRVRPLLVAAGYALGKATFEVPAGAVRFAAGLELLHTFMLVHDDVADRARSRRGGLALHHVLGNGKEGEDLAIVAGDHLYALALESMLGCGLPGAAQATQYMLQICRHTAAGQYLDLALSAAPLPEVTLFSTLKVAHLKTAKYGFVAPLVAGAMLAGSPSASLLEGLERVGRQAGLAFQLRDDLLGLFGDDAVAGKDGGGDFHEGKRTFPVIAAWTRANETGRSTLEALWARPYPKVAGSEAELLAMARSEVARWGGRAATQRVIDRMTRSAQRALVALPNGGGARLWLDGLLARLARRAA